MTVVRRIASPVVRPLVRAINAAYGISAFTPARLFTTGVNGAWYDPSDTTTLFQNAAGTTPVTAVEQPVGLMLDKSKNGVGTNGAKRVNLLTKTEDFSDAYWYKTPATATVPVTNATSPIGTSTACKFVEGTTNAFHSVGFTAASSPAALVSTKYKFSVYVKPAGRTWIALELNNPNVAGYTTYFNLSGSGSIGQNPGANTDVSIVEFPVGSGWYLCSISRTTLSNQTQIQPSILPKTGDGGSSYTGDGTSGIYIWGADIRLASEASTLPTYQRITDTWYNTLPGNHAFNGSGNSANFPVLSARKNKLLATAVLSTQTVTTRAVGHVLSFWGTGTITLSGTSTAGPLVGTGASDRVYLEFTPTAGTLTLTVSGSVLKAQLEEVNETV